MSYDSKIIYPSCSLDFDAASMSLSTSKSACGPCRQRATEHSYETCRPSLTSTSAPLAAHTYRSDDYYQDPLARSDGVITDTELSSTLRPESLQSSNVSDCEDGFYDEFDLKVSGQPSTVRPRVAFTYYLPSLRAIIRATRADISWPRRLATFCPRQRLYLCRAFEITNQQALEEHLQGHASTAKRLRTRYIDTSNINPNSRRVAR